MNIIVEMKFGAHLYGTQSPESDTDIMGIYMPSFDDMILSRVKKTIKLDKKVSQGSKNTSKDIDKTFHSLQHFIEMACTGRIEALDMLHAPSDMIIQKSDIWDTLVARRSEFYTNNLESLVEYAQGQASKYGIKGSRLAAAMRVMEIIQKHPLWIIGCKSVKMHEIWDQLPEAEYLHHIKDSPNGFRQYEVCTRIIQETVSLDYAYDVLSKFYDSYGARARKAKLNKGIDWKAVSHAVRAAYEIEEILEHRTITFPLKRADFIREIKLGKYHYLNDVAPILEHMIDHVKLLAEKSILPPAVDIETWDQFILDAVKGKYGKANQT